MSATKKAAFESRDTLRAPPMPEEEQPSTARPGPPVIVHDDAGEFDPAARPSLSDPQTLEIQRQGQKLDTIESLLEIIARDMRHMRAAQVRQADVMQEHLAHGAKGNGLHGATVLLVDDVEVLSSAVARALSAAGAVVHEAHSIYAARQVMREHGPTITSALIDERLGDGYGSSLAVELRRDYPALRIVMTSAYPQDRDEGAFDLWLPKPAPIAELKAALLP